MTNDMDDERSQRPLCLFLKSTRYIRCKETTGGAGCVIKIVNVAIIYIKLLYNLQVGVVQSWITSS